MPRDNITQGLSVMANVCFEMVLNKRFDSDTTNMFCLRAMTGNVVVRARLLSLCVCLCVFFVFILFVVCVAEISGAIILYDHIHLQGAFIKKSPINVTIQT